MILVTGGAGYIGSHVAQHLVDCGEGVIVLDDLSTGHAQLLPGCRFVQGNITNAPLVAELLSDVPVDAVIHFAASSLVAESYADPLRYWRNNVAGATALLECLAKSGVRQLVLSSSAAVYGDAAEQPIAENAVIAPVNPYGATKAAIERILHDCERAFGLRSVSLRYFNAAGADLQARRGEWHVPESHLIPLLLEAAGGSREEVVVFGDDYPTPDGTCVRDYVHVLDLADAHGLALRHLQAGGSSRTYNLGSGSGSSVLEVIRTVEKVTGTELRLRRAPRRAGDPPMLVADSQRIRSELGWAPRHSDLPTIVSSAWRWYQQMQRGNTTAPALPTVG